VKAGVKVIDIAADFRLKEPGAFEQWMGGGQPHRSLRCSSKPFTASRS
jgi:N-acetyl-gamma-glutamylphosphate reductase